MASFTFGQVPSVEAEHAFAFHHKVAQTNAHIWPRTEEQIRRFADDGQLFACRRTETSEFVALCYIHHEDTNFELGGLITDESVRGRGIGTFLTRLAIAHTMAFERPWRYGQELIAYVHQENDDPRTLLLKVGFESSGSVTVPKDITPPSMKKNAAGEMVGDVFTFSKGGLDQLRTWLREFDGTLGNGHDEAVIDLGPITINELAAALDD